MNKNNGFTLIELVVSITIMGILSVVAVAIINVGIDSYNLYTAKSTMGREAQNTMRYMHDTISMADPATISYSTSARFRFVTTSGDLVYFRYRSAYSDMVYITTGSSSRRILHNITAFTFTYAKSDGTAWVATDPVDEINRITVNYNLSMLGQSENYTYNFTIRN